MQLRIAIAGAIRALRLKRGLRYEHLYEASAKSKISALERGETSITLEKFEALSEALKIDSLALLALSMSAQQGIPYSSLINNAYEQLRAFEAEGGIELLAEQFANEELVQRPRGKPANTENLNAVRRLKEAGLSQARIADELGLSPTIVNRHWKRIASEDPKT
ncbi:helix-turn-helix domain-containing protein [Pseudomonas sp. s4]|uniref:helix-turn-helix domain-containing protein n=1 Tax=Pseudomonas sp. s4 TaxID=353218 RepID=UPI00398D3878